MHHFSSKLFIIGVMLLINVYSMPLLCMNNDSEEQDVVNNMLNIPIDKLEAYRATTSPKKYDKNLEQQFIYSTLCSSDIRRFHLDALALFLTEYHSLLSFKKNNHTNPSQDAFNIGIECLKQANIQLAMQYFKKAAKPTATIIYQFPQPPKTRKIYDNSAVLACAKVAIYLNQLPTAHRYLTKVIKQSFYQPYPTSLVIPLLFGYIANQIRYPLSITYLDKNTQVKNNILSILNSINYPFTNNISPSKHATEHDLIFEIEVNSSNKKAAKLINNANSLIIRFDDNPLDPAELGPVTTRLFDYLKIPRQFFIAQQEVASNEAFQKKLRVKCIELKFKAIYVQKEFKPAKIQKARGRKRQIDTMPIFQTTSSANPLLMSHKNTKTIGQKITNLKNSPPELAQLQNHLDSVRSVGK